VATVSLTLPIITHAVTIESFNFHDTFYNLIKSTDQLVTDLIEEWVSKELKDLAEVSTINSRSISKVEVGVKGVIQVELENNSTLEIPIKRTKFTAQNRDRFLLAFKTGDELTTGTVKIMRAEEQIYLKSNPVKETSKEYQLLFNYYILKDTTSGLKLLGKEGLDSDQIQEADEDQLKKMAMQYRGLIHAMLEQVRGGGRSEKCLKILKEIVDGNAEKIKLAKDRVKDLELLLNKTISSLAESLKNSLKKLPLQANSHVKTELMEMRFSVTLDDGSQ